MELKPDHTQEQSGQRLRKIRAKAHRRDLLLLDLAGRVAGFDGARILGVEFEPDHPRDPRPSAPSA